MGLHKNKIILIIKKKKHSVEHTDTHRVGENLYQWHFGYKFIARIYQELQKLNSKDIKLPINIWPYNLNKHFVKKETHMANKCCKVFRIPKMLSRKCKLKLLWNTASLWPEWLSSTNPTINVRENEERKEP